VNYAAKDEKGQTVSRATAEHMAKFRVRCATCTENFCTNCKIMPYHINMTCEEAATKKAAVKCRYCWDMMDQPDLTRPRAFQDVCKKKDCVDLMNMACDKFHPCNHVCKGYVRER